MSTVISLAILALSSTFGCGVNEQFVSSNDIGILSEYFDVNNIQMDNNIR